ncbi:MAG: hypothetical protein HY253_01185 [Burkholderiales bacterium]|nr:hypothetical protein [Burkholderiales bacterium]
MMRWGFAFCVVALSDAVKLASLCLRVLLLLSTLLCIPVQFAAAEALPRLAAQVVPFLSVRAGLSSVADVERVLGAPVRQIKPDLFEYAAPAGSAGASMDMQKIQVEYFSDSHLVARIDAWLGTPVLAADVRSRFGQAVLTQTRKDGQREELFFPQLMGVITSLDQPDVVLAISYLAPAALANVYCDLSQQAIRERRYADAKEPADNAVLVDPDYARAFLAQGIHFYYLKEFDEAMVRFVAATRAKYPARKIAHAHAWLAAVYWMKKSQPEQARAEFAKALAIAPDFDLVQLEYGRFLKAQKELDAAMQAFLKASELGQAQGQTQTANEARMELAILLVGRKASDKALPYLTQLAAWADGGGKSSVSILSADYIYAYYGYALAAVRGERNLMMGGDDPETQKVIAAYEKAVRLETKATWVYAALGSEYEDSSEWAKAEAVYRRGLVLDARHLGLNQKLADVLVEAGQYEAALRQAELALTMAPNDAERMMTMARAYGLLKRGQEAVTWLRKAGAAGYRAQYRRSIMLEEGVFDDWLSEEELRRLLPGGR